MKNKKAVSVKFVVMLIVIVAVVATGVCSGYFWQKRENIKEQTEIINYYLDLTLPENSKIAEYKIEKTKIASDYVTDVLVVAKVVFPESEYDEFIASIKDYSERSDLFHDTGGYGVSWWDIDYSKLKNNIWILELPKETEEEGIRKMTAATNIIIVDNGDNCEMYMSYYG